MRRHRYLLGLALVVVVGALIALLLPEGGASIPSRGDPPVVGEAELVRIAGPGNELGTVETDRFEERKSDPGPETPTVPLKMPPAIPAKGPTARS